MISKISEILAELERGLCAYEKQKHWALGQKKIICVSADTRRKTSLGFGQNTNVIKTLGYTWKFRVSHVSRNTYFLGCILDMNFNITQNNLYAIFVLVLEMSYLIPKNGIL